MLVHRMTLFSFQLFRKNLGNLREFFGQMVHPPPPPPLEKDCPYAYDNTATNIDIKVKKNKIKLTLVIAFLNIVV